MEKNPCEARFGQDNFVIKTILFFGFTPWFGLFLIPLAILQIQYPNQILKQNSSFPKRKWILFHLCVDPRLFSTTHCQLKWIY